MWGRCGRVHGMSAGGGEGRCGERYGGVEGKGRCGG